MVFLQDLRSRTVLYSICRKPYDKERAMIACDSCSEWYHSDCVTLPEPDSCDDESPDMVQKFGSAGEFLCPNCKPDESPDFLLKKRYVKNLSSFIFLPSLCLSCFLIDFALSHINICSVCR